MCTRMVKIDSVSVTLGVYVTCITVLTGMTGGGSSVSLTGIHTVIVSTVIPNM